MTDACISEEKMEEIERKIDMLLRTIEEKDHEIASLKNYIESCDATKSSQTPAMKDKGKLLCRKTIHNT